MSYTDPANAGTPATGQTIKTAWGVDVQQDIEYAQTEFLLVNEGPVNPVMAKYGATGNGTTDDTTAFQNCVNDWKTAARNGSKNIGLYLPDGYAFYLTRSIDCTGVGSASAQFFGGGTGASQITAKLTDGAYPILDFTGSARCHVHDFRITGQAGGLQSALILGARSNANSTGDDIAWDHLLLEGTAAVVGAGLISCDLSSLRDMPSGTITAPSGLFVGKADTLGITSKYQTFAATTGNTICTLDNVTLGATSRSGIVFADGALLRLTSVYMALNGALHGIELLGSGGLSVVGDFRIESPGSAVASQDAIYVNSTTGPTVGMVQGTWNFNATTDCAMVRFAGTQAMVEYWLLGLITNAGAGTIKTLAGASGSFSDGVVFNRNRYTADTTPTSSLVVGAGGSGNNWQMPGTVLPDSGILNVAHPAAGDVGVQIGGDGQSGDPRLRIYRGGGTTEYIQLLAAAGGTSGLNNLLALVLGNAGTLRDWNVYDYNGTTFTRVGGLSAAGRHPRYSTAANMAMGTATLAAGTVTVANTSVTASSVIFLSRATTGGTTGQLSYTITAGTSFTINSSSNTETSTVNWLIAEPA